MAGPPGTGLPAEVTQSRTFVPGHAGAGRRTMSVSAQRHRWAEETMKAHVGDGLVVKGGKAATRARAR